MGPAEDVVQTAAVVLDPQVLWRQDRTVLLLAGLLHKHADLSVSSGRAVLHLRTGLDELGR